MREAAQLQGRENIKAKSSLESVAPALECGNLVSAFTLGVAGGCWRSKI
jgi:hypothetical protein